MRKTEIAEDFTSRSILQDVTGSEANTIVQGRIREDEVVQIIIPTVELRHHVTCAKPTKLD